MQKPIVNPYTKSSSVAKPGQATIHDGWEYDEKTHAIRFVVPNKAFINEWALDPSDAVVAKSKK